MMEIIDLSEQGATAAEIPLTTEKLITLYLAAPPALKNNYKVAIQISPDDGTTWITTDAQASGRGQVSIECVATKARVKLIRTKQQSNTIKVCLLAR